MKLCGLRKKVIQLGVFLSGSHILILTTVASDAESGRHKASGLTELIFKVDAAYDIPHSTAYDNPTELHVTLTTNNQNTALNRNYNYDPIGNRVSAAEPGNSIAQSYTANALNQYTHINAVSQTSSLVFDADGNLLTDGTGKIYVWDGENRLVQVTVPNGEVIRYSYDGQSRRVKREQVNGTSTEATAYLYDGWNVVREVTGNIVKHYVWGNDLSDTLQRAGGVGGLLGVVDSGSGKMHYTYDANGNVSELIGSDSGVRAHYEYDAFGKETVASGSQAQANTYRFSTKPWDAVAALNYYGYRFYQPKEGRWINKDPIEESGSYNLYLSTMNNMITRVDYLGLLPDWFIRCFMNSCHNACQQAKDKGIDDGDVGGVICCNRQKFYCNWGYKGLPFNPNPPPPDNSQAATILSGCVLEHENDHSDDVDCDSLEGDNLHRPGWKPGKDTDKEECDAYAIELSCVKSKRSKCNNDPVCLKLLDARISFIETTIKAQYKCTNL